MATTNIKNYNVTPYYDDFDESKGFHRILFKPGVSVQARELTQLQTLLQAQIDRHGKYSFKEGDSVINGEVSLNIDRDFIKVESSFTHSSTDYTTTAAVLDSIVGSTLTGATNGVTAMVDAVEAAEGSNPHTIYISYTNSGTNNTTKAFANGEVLQSDASGTPFVKVGAGSGSSITNAVGKNSSFNIKEGVFFLRGNFVFVPAGSITLDNSNDKYTQTPNNVVGLQITESLVQSTTDSSLVDNALGAPNFSAPGADRYAITTTLVKAANVASIGIENFVILAEIENGIMKTDKTDDTEVPLDRRLAKRTFEESGNYSVSPYQLNIKEHLDTGSNFGYLTSGNGGSATKASIQIEPNVAYVKGFRVENTVTNKDIAIDKPRTDNTTTGDVRQITGYSQTLTVGNYVKLDPADCQGIPSLYNFETIDLHNAADGGGSKVGEARCRGIEVFGSEIRLYLFDIQMSSGNFGAVRSFVQGSTFAADFLSGAEGLLFDTGNNTAVFPLPFRAVKDADASTTITVKMRLESSTNGNTVTLSSHSPAPPGVGTTSTVVDPSTIIAQIVDASSGAFTGQAGNYGASVSGGTVTFNQQAGSGKKFVALVNCQITGRTAKQKQAQTATNEAVTISSRVGALDNSDVYEITDIRTANSGGGISIKDQFTLDDGQRENFYDNGNILLKPGFSDPGTVYVTYKYYSHDQGSFFTVDSYPDFENIPTFNSINGKLELRDCIDFRPRKADSGADNFTGTNKQNLEFGFPTSGNSYIATIQHWLGRTDTLFVDKNGEFGTVTGVSDERPRAPTAPDDAMALFHLKINPYVFKAEDDIKPVLIDNKRYTMRDIGRLDKRLKNVEYFTSLSLLEQSAASIQLGGGASERLKNGFIVDNFFGTSKADTSNPEYSAATDRNRGVLRPQSINRNVNLVRKASDAVANSSTHQLAVKSTSLVHLPFTETTFVNQPFSSERINVNPYNIWVWNGMIELSPDSDEWKDTDVRPTIYIDDSSAFDQFKQMAEEEGILGTVWNEWETTWTGVEVETETFVDEFDDGSFDETTITTTTTTSNQSRSGLKTELSFDTVTKSDGTKVISVNFVPFIRSRVVNFKAQLLKPNTRFYPFFDGADISSLTRTETFSNSNPFEFSDQASVDTFEGQTAHPDGSGVSLVSDATGALNGSFLIPRNDALKFAVGTREFRLSDDSSNRRNIETSSAEAAYTAAGTVSTLQETITSTKVPRLVHSELSDSRTIVESEVETETTRWEDPLAQTILIDRKGGLFCSSVEVFFRTKDASIPVRLTIRTTKNGIPTQKIVPGADKVLYPSEVSVASDQSANNSIGNADTSTKFSFDHPVYLNPDVEYAIVLTSNSDGYEAYVANMGGQDLTDNSKRISKQPYNGVFFTSQNASTWTPEQSKDLKFKLNRCEFDISKKGEMNLINDVIPAKRININSLETTSGSKAFVVNAKNHGLKVGHDVSITGCQAAVNGIPAADINAGHNITAVTHDSFTCENQSGSTNATSTGKGGGGGIRATINNIMDVVYPYIENIQVPGTKLNFYMKPMNTGFTKDSNEIKILPNRNFFFASSRMISGSENKSVNHSSVDSFDLRCEFESTDSGLSPIIDMNRLSLFAIQNRINSETEGTSANAGLNVSKHITKVITLDEPADEADVFISVKKPAGTDVELYWRASDDADADLSNVAYTLQATVDGTAIPINDRKFQEVHYNPDPLGDGNPFAKIQFKIVLKSSNSAIVPEVKDFRAICST